jgi:hypothetical protein
MLMEPVSDLIGSLTAHHLPSSVASYVLIPHYLLPLLVHAMEMANILRVFDIEWIL